LVSEHGTLWASDAPADLVEPRVAANFGELHPPDAEALAGAIGLPDAEALRRRFAGARRCYAAWVGGRIAGYGWASQGSECVGELERAFHMPAGEAYVWDCATLPDYRGRRLYSALLSHMLIDLRRAGVRRVWIGASIDNRPSIRGFATAGFQPILRVRYLRLANLRCCWATSYPEAPERLVAAARRMIAARHERALGPLIAGFASPRRCP